MQLIPFDEAIGCSLGITETDRMKPIPWIGSRKPDPTASAAITLLPTHGIPIDEAVKF